MGKNRKWIAILAAIIIIGAGIGFFIGRWSTKPERERERNNLIAARDSIEVYQIVVNNLEYVVREKNSLILTQKEAIKAGVLERDMLRALNMKIVATNASLEGTIKILRDSLKLVPGTVIITVKDTSGISRDYVRIPFKLLDVKEEYLTLSAGMNANRTAYFDLRTPIRGQMTIGYKKSGFLKTTPVGSFVSQNPYLAINNMDILIVQEKKTFFQKTWVHVATGATIAIVTIGLLSR